MEADKATVVVVDQPEIIRGISDFVPIVAIETFMKHDPSSPAAEEQRRQDQAKQWELQAANTQRAKEEYLKVASNWDDATAHLRAVPGMEEMSKGSIHPLTNAQVLCSPEVDDPVTSEKVAKEMKKQYRAGPNEDLLEMLDKQSERDKALVNKHPTGSSYTLPTGTSINNTYSLTMTRNDVTVTVSAPTMNEAWAMFESARCRAFDGVTHFMPAGVEVKPKLEQRATDTKNPFCWRSPMGPSEFINPPIADKLKSLRVTSTIPLEALWDIDDGHLTLTLSPKEAPHAQPQPPKDRS